MLCSEHTVFMTKSQASKPYLLIHNLEGIRTNQQLNGAAHNFVNLAHCQQESADDCQSVKQQTFYHY
jgi:hypothetical protein